MHWMHKWCKADPLKNPVNDCHEMVQDAKGRIILLTNETKNNIMIFNTSGKLLKTWGDSFPGGHGLTLADDTLFITDTNKHQVYKTDTEGKILLTLDAPKEDNLYPKPEQFVPTEVAVTPKVIFMWRMVMVPSIFFIMMPMES